MTTRFAAALASHRYLRSKRVLCRANGKPLIQQEVQRIVQGVERLASVDHLGVHALLHGFCSHLAMRGAPPKAIQELAGHSEAHLGDAEDALEPDRQGHRHSASGAPAERTPRLACWDSAVTCISIA